MRTDAARQQLRTALDELPATWRAVVVRRDIDGHADADVARELGLTRAQERSILARARAALRDQLEELNPRRGDA